MSTAATSTGNDQPDREAIDPDILDLEPMARNFGFIGPTVIGLLALFLANMDTLTGMLVAQVGHGDGEAARMAAHAAAGAAHTAGARRLGLLLSRIEALLAEGDTATAALAATAIDHELAEVRRMISRL
jgi:HPt (histidine-containing phosphotransfer) domain-containing protein